MSHAVLLILRSLRESGLMFWETFWALVLGFSLSGAVQAFVSPDRMREKLGDHRPRAVMRATGYGMVSSSCSYAASAMAKSLFTGGADFTTSMIFMIASTNLVVELGIVMLVLLGWQFAAAEFVGGPIMIALLALVGTAVFAAPLVSRARERARAMSSEHDMHDMSIMPERSMRSVESWSNASTYAVADATMLRRELLIGYVVAGFLAVMVPTSWWGDVFLRGHGPWTSVENAFVGPLIAVVSWVCSVGNVPLAAALWHGGISFGGVVAFIFADLIAMPLILIYRKFYGGALTMRVVAVFYAVMVSAGLITEVLFRAAGLVPTARKVHLGADRVTWNYTTFLNIVFLFVAWGLWALARRRRHLGEESGYAIDPVCSMQVRLSDAPARTTLDAKTYYFCSDRCREKFLSSRSGIALSPVTPVPTTISARPARTSLVVDTGEPEFIDPICGMHVTPRADSPQRLVEGVAVYFCCEGCAQQFDEQRLAH